MGKLPCLQDGLDDGCRAGQFASPPADHAHGVAGRQNEGRVGSHWGSDNAEWGQGARLSIRVRGAMWTGLRTAPCMRSRSSA